MTSPGCGLEQGGEEPVLEVLAGRDLDQTLVAIVWAGSGSCSQSYAAMSLLGFVKPPGKSRFRIVAPSS